MLKKRDLLVVLIVALLAGAVLLIVPRLAPAPEKGARYCVIVSVNGVKRDPVPLPEEGEATLLVEQETGEYNALTLTPSGVRMSESSCQNQLCVHQGEVTPENRFERPLQSLIICLPNRVTAELTTSEEAAQ